MANQITVNSGTGNITVTTSRSVIGTVANVASANYANFAGEANTSNSATVAASANSVALANVVGAGNIASINLDGNVSNVLRGDGTFSGLPDSANANFANFAGTVTNSAQPNITSLGTLGNLTVSGGIQTNDLTVTGNFSVGNLVANNANYANFAGIAFSVDGANVSGEVANANFATNAGTANIANVAYSVDGANVSGEVAVANVVSNPTQSNITAVGTLGNLDVSGTITANLIQANTIEGNIALTKVDYIDFDTANGSPGFQTGRVYWDSAKGTLALDMNGGGNITQQVGEDQYIYVQANATITAGQVVMFNGVVGDTILGAPANTASAGFLPRYVIGVAPANIANGNTGYVQTVGEVYDLQTNAFSAGSILYLQANSAGALTATEPTAPDPKIVVAACLTQSTTPSSTNGRIQVRPDFGYYTDQLHDVSNATPSTGDVLIRNSSNVYVPGNTVPAWNIETANKANLALDATILTVDGLNDYYKVLTTEPDYGNFLFYTGEATTLKNYENSPGFGVLKFDQHYVEDTGNAALGFAGSVQLSAVDTFNPANAAIASFYNVLIPTASSDLSSFNPATWVQFSVGAGGTGLGVTDGSGANSSILGLNHYSEKGISFNRRNGNGASRNNVSADDYLAKIEWRPAGRNGGGNVAYNTRTSFISAKVDSAYTGANAETVPQGFEINVVDSSNNNIAHSFYANGDVALNGNVTANNLGNVSALNLDGNASNILFGNGVFAAAPTAGSTDSISNGNSSIGFTGVDGDVSIIIDNANTVSISQNQLDVSGDIIAEQANIAEIALTPNLTTFDGRSSFIKSSNSYADFANNNFRSSELHLLKNYDSTDPNFQGFGIVKEDYFYAEDENSNIARTGLTSWKNFGTLGSGNTTLPAEHVISAPVAASDLASANTLTWTTFGIGFAGLQGTSTVVGSNIGNQAAQTQFQFSPVGIRFQRRNGNNANRQPIIADEYVSNIEWNAGGKNFAGSTAFNSVTATFGGKVDNSYTGANGETVPQGFELNVVNSSNTRIPHSFYANGDVVFNSSGTITGNGAGLSSLAGANVTGEVSFAATANSVALANVSGAGNIANIDIDGNINNVLRGDGTFGTTPTGSSIENGTSNIAFTGSGGDLSVKIDGNVRSQFGPDGLQLLGANTGASDISRLDITNGSLFWLLDNTQFFGGTPFGMNQYNNAGSLAYGLNFFRARGDNNAPADVQAGDQGYSKSTQFRYDNTTVQSHTELVTASSFSGSDVAVTHAISADSDTANSKFDVTFGEARFSNHVTANGNISGSNVTATSFVVLANDTASNLTSNTPAVVGVAGAMIAVSDQDYQPAHWSVTDNVWKYVSNRANV